MHFISAAESLKLQKDIDDKITLRRSEYGICVYFYDNEHIRNYIVRP